MHEYKTQFSAAVAAVGISFFLVLVVDRNNGGLLKGFVVSEALYVACVAAVCHFPSSGAL